MCQVHTDPYVSILAPKKLTLPLATQDHHVYITRSIYHYAYARQTQVSWRKEIKKRKEDKGKERKEKKGKKVNSYQAYHVQDLDKECTIRTKNKRYLK